MEEAPLDEDGVSTEYPAIAEDEEAEEEDAEEEAIPVVVTPAVKKRGRPSGSKNRAPDIYTTLLDRMSQLEETLNRRQSESSTGGTIGKNEPDTPPPVTRPKRQPKPRAVVMAPPSPPISQLDLLMEQIAQSREARRLRQLEFYNTFLPS